MEHTIQGAILLELEGELDFSARKEFLDAIHQTLHQDQTHVIVDLQGITCADEAAMSLLVIAHQKLFQHYRRLSLLHPPIHLANKLHSMKFPRIIPIYHSLEEAIKRKIFPLPLFN